MQSSFTEDAHQCLAKVLNEKQPMILKVAKTRNTDLFKFKLSLSVLTGHQMWVLKLAFFQIVVPGPAGLGFAVSTLPIKTLSGLQSESARSVKLSTQTGCPCSLDIRVCVCVCM